MDLKGDLKSFPIKGLIGPYIGGYPYTILPLKPDSNEFAGLVNFKGFTRKV